MPAWKAMIRYKFRISSIYYGIQRMWRALFILVCIGTILVAGTRYYISKPRSLSVVLTVLQKMGYPIYAKESSIEWKWHGRPCVMFRDVQWRNRYTILCISQAKFELRFLLTHPVRALWVQNIRIAYVTPKKLPLNLLTLWSTITALLQRVSQVEQCSITGGITVFKDRALQTRIESFSWTPEQIHKKISGYMEGELGKVEWSYIPCKRYIHGRFTNGVGKLMKRLGYPVTFCHPASVECFFNASTTTIKISWDKKDFLVGKKNYHLQNGTITGVWNSDCGRLKGKVGMDDLTIFIKGRYHNAWTASWKSTGNIPIKSLEFWWNKSWGINAKNWVDDHFRLGILDQFKGRISGTLDVLQDLHGSFFIKKSYLTIVPGMPDIENLYSRAEFNLNEFNFYVEKALFSKQSVESGHIHIHDLSENSNLTLGLRLEGGVQDILKILNCKKLNVTSSLPIQHAQGRAHTQLRMRFPLLLDLHLQDIILEYESGFENTQFDVKALGVILPYEQGTIQIKGTQHDVSIQGEGQMNRHPVLWTWNSIFKTPVHQKLTMDLWIDPCLWIPSWIHSCIKKELFPVQVEYFPGRGKLIAHMDAKKVELNIPWLQWTKKSEDGLTLKCEFLEKKKQLTFHTKGSIDSQGKFFLNKELKGEARFYIPGVLHGGLALHPDLQKIRLTCKYLDLSLLNSDYSKRGEEKKLNIPNRAHQKQCTVEADLNIQSLKWDKVTKIQGIKGVLSWNYPSIGYSILDLDQCRWLKSEARCVIRTPKDSGTVHFSAVPKQENTTIHVICKGLSGVFHILGLKSIAHSGDSGEWVGKQTSNGAYKGRLVCRDVVTQGLWMAKILSLFSPSALTELLHSSLDFSEISVKCSYNRGVLQLKKGIARGLNLGAFLKGDVNFKTRTLFLKGGIVPAYFMNTFFSHVPIIGHILGQEKGIISSKFIISGSLKDPDFFVNPFSIFELGGLKTLFE
ncbi:DUF3971 domain-containing protein [Holospora curviuscula]|uniref:AsmA-like C-terminal domain-containing protein n=1 Tax=Holospora curviuscula TaxID=1082868 RepID=A0A2S5R763_9PROT|nr:DUF3971 domain-containing protein [Holospora curviuscula]PPE03176.1 hypothetical protein HCUR_01376 [Holospora curviuscula]